MNIVYKFTSKVTGKWYIGSKIECTVIGNEIFDRKGKVYCTSSYDQDLRKEFLQGNMILDVLESHIPREDLLSRERYYQEMHSAVEDANSYNKCYAMAGFTNAVGNHKHTDIGNIYGQTIKEIANHNSLVSRKDVKANSVGFPDYGTMYYTILKDKQISGRTFLSYDKEYGQNGFFKRVLKGISYKDFEIDVDLTKIRYHVVRGCTFFKACEIEGHKDYVVRFHFGEDFKKIFELEERLAIHNGFATRQELEYYIMREYLSGKNIKAIEGSLKSISNSTIQRVIERLVRERLKVSDFE